MTAPARQLDLVPDSEIVTLLRDLGMRRSFNPPGEEAQVGTQVADWLRPAGLIVSVKAAVFHRGLAQGLLAGQRSMP